MLACQRKYCGGTKGFENKVVGSQDTDREFWLLCQMFVIARAQKSHVRNPRMLSGAEERREVSLRDK